MGLIVPGYYISKIGPNTRMRRKDPADLIAVGRLERRLLVEEHQRKSDSHDYGKDDNNEIHMKRWPIEHIPKI